VNKVGYTRIADIKDLGGYVVPNILAPEYQGFDTNDEAWGVLGDLSLVVNDQATTPVFHLPLATQPGQVCGVKSMLQAALGPPMDIVGSEDIENGYTQSLYAGINAQSIEVCSFLGNVGETAIFVSGRDLDFDPPRLSWYLVSYLPGSSYTP